MGDFEHPQGPNVARASPIILASSELDSGRGSSSASWSIDPERL